MMAISRRVSENKTPPLKERGGSLVRPGDKPAAALGKGWGLSVEKLAELHARAADMRNNPTEPEKRLWRHLSNSHLGGHKFRRQSVIGAYIVDFLCPQRALIVEVDGGTHEETRDLKRDEYLVSRGFRVLRVRNEDVMSNMEGTLTVIAQALDEAQSRWTRPHPNPSPEGEGPRAEMA